MMQDYGRMWTRIKNDPEYAWSWHCNIAMALHDDGIEHRQANEHAARVMHALFGVEVRELDNWINLFGIDATRG